MAHWRVDIIRRRAEHLGTIEAPNDKEAIQKAIERFAVQPELQNRLVVQKMRRWARREEDV